MKTTWAAYWMPIAVEIIASVLKDFVNEILTNAIHKPFKHS